MAVGVGLDHGHEGAALGQQGAQGGGVVPQGVQVDLRPGPAPPGRRGPSAPPPPQGKGQGQRAGEQDYRQIVDGAALHQQGGEAQHLGRAPHQHDAQGMQDVDRRGPGAQGGLSVQAQPPQPQDQQGHAEGQGQVEGVEVRKAKLLYSNTLDDKQRQRPTEGGGILLRGPPGRAAGQHTAQQEEDRGEKDAVAGQAEEGEVAFIGRAQRGQQGGQAEVAVPQQPQEVQPGADAQGDPRPAAQAQQHADQTGPQHGRGEVPQVVEGAVQENVPQEQPGQAGLLEVAAVKTDGEVE